ncbi:serine carboxypeptidase-like 18 [Quercus suber]|uniref:Serine carboxypeptidase-like 18 n=1 Tax=Quercus suber TaxID=58331 RepID=A0AAW0LLV1_QUESU
MCTKQTLMFNSSTRIVKMCLSILLLLVFSTIAFSQSVIEYVPGYPGKLPFKLETGYIGVGETDEVQLFYYFIESERSPANDPLVFWLTGGPGCSGFSALAYEIGPLTFDYASFNGTSPAVTVNPYAWTQVANIIFIDAPVGAGFSYATTSEGYYTSDTKSAQQSYIFLRKWLLDHPQFLGNQLYIGGDSYSGLIVPMLVKHGYLLGNPVTDSYTDVNFRIPYVHRVNLISDELYEAARYNCHEDYVNYNINNTLCVTALQAIKECLLQINLAQILEPQCAFASGKPKEVEWDLRVQEFKTMNYLLSETKLPELECRGTVGSWVRCPKALSTYTEDVTSSVAYQKNLTETGLRALIYSGDHDISVPWVATYAWIKALGGAGHTAPEYKHKETLAMVDRFFARYPI